MDQLKDEISGRVSPSLESRGLTLWNVDVKHSRGGVSVQIQVDNPNGVDLDLLAELAREIKPELVDHCGVAALEISSPGVERQLVTKSHFQAVVGEDVKLTVRELDQQGDATGKLVEANDDYVIVQTDTGKISASYDDISQAVTVFDWSKVNWNASS